MPIMANTCSSRSRSSLALYPHLHTREPLGFNLLVRRFMLVHALNQLALGSNRHQNLLAWL